MKITDIKPGNKISFDLFSGFSSIEAHAIQTAAEERKKSGKPLEITGTGRSIVIESITTSEDPTTTKGLSHKWYRVTLKGTIV